MGRMQAHLRFRDASKQMKTLEWLFRGAADCRPIKPAFELLKPRQLILAGWTAGLEAGMTLGPPSPEPTLWSIPARSASHR